jgi:serine/threonine protein kinase
MLSLQRYKIQQEQNILEESVDPLLILTEGSKGTANTTIKSRMRQVLQTISTTTVKKEIHIQEVFDTKFGEQSQISMMGWEYRSTYRSKVFGNMSPDALLVVKHGPSNALHTVGVIEYENIGGDSFSDDHKEKVIIYNEFALSKQGYRPSIISFLCSSKWALLVYSYRERNETNLFKHKVSTEFQLQSEMALNIFSTYCSMSLEDHKFYIPQIKEFVLQDFLGSGSFSFVYKVHRAANDEKYYAAKVFKDYQHFRTEKATLELLETMKVKNVPRIVNISEATFGGSLRNVLILEPVADKLEAPGYTDYRSLTLRDIEGAIETLEAMHKLKILHRDLRPPNLLLQSEGILISDFGCTLLHQDGTKV